MDRLINILDDSTIDKIAAGEVIERPVSVVKELVENSIDSDATAITVEIKDGGLSYIRVTDNGCGISRSQVRTAFLRHATSKIKSVEDLINVNSLGFRGEALSSIASIAKVELLTKVKEEFSGTRFVIEGSKEMALEDVGVPDGTTFIVRHIFFNTPARRKFLKSAQTEGSYISDYLEKVMLSHPNIAFKLIINSNTRLQSSGNGQIDNIIYALYGRDMVKRLLPINVSDGDITIQGFVGKPELSRGNRSFEIYYVNSRFIQSTIIRRALDEAYSKHLMLHKYPVVFLYLTISPDLIDVNVHPTKKEIRFLEANQVYELLVKGIQEVLARSELIIDIDTPEKKNVNIIPQSEVRPEPFEKNRLTQIEAKSIKAPAIDSIKENTSSNEATIIKPSDSINNQSLEINTDNTVSDASLVDADSFNSTIKTLEKTTVSQMSLFEDGFLSTEGLKRHKIIGQLFDTYWLIEMDSQLYIIDQHAAHEKVKYEQIIKQLGCGEVESQNLNPPIIVTLSKSEEATLERYTDNFSRLGFEIEHFGGNEYSIRAIPTNLFLLTPNEYFHDLLDELMTERRSSNVMSVDHRIATMACKSAVKGNTKLSYKEAEALIDELLTLDNPYNCPHGRPTIITFKKSEIEKMFKRIIN